MKDIHDEKAGNTNPNQIKCEKCDFNAKSEEQLRKHIGVVHMKRNITCWFWKNSQCQKQQNCEYQHPRLLSCRYQLSCRDWPNCKFTHNENTLCNYQQNCSNQNCSKQHLKQMKPCHFQNHCQNQRCQFQHFDKQSQNDFLGQSSQSFHPDLREFPPLGSARRTW